MDASAFLFPKCASTFSFLLPSSSTMNMSTAWCLNSLTSVPASIQPSSKKSRAANSTLLPKHHTRDDSLACTQPFDCSCCLDNYTSPLSRAPTSNRLLLTLMLTPGPLHSDLPGPNLERDIVRDVHQTGGNDLLHCGAVTAAPLASLIWKPCMAAKAQGPVRGLRLRVLLMKGNKIDTLGSDARSFLKPCKPPGNAEWLNNTFPMRTGVFSSYQSPLCLLGCCRM